MTVTMPYYIQEFLQHDYGNLRVAVDLRQVAAVFDYRDSLSGESYTMIMMKGVQMCHSVCEPYEEVRRLWLAAQV